MKSDRKLYKSHGSGRVLPNSFAKAGANLILEEGVLVFHPENIYLGANIYVGHQAIIKGYWKNTIVIGDNCWIGQQVFLHGGGGIVIGSNVGLGPGTKIISSSHAEEGRSVPILHSQVRFAAVVIGDDSDIGVNSTILPGVTIGKGVQVGAGSVVTKDLPDYSVACGVPARVIRFRN